MPASLSSLNLVELVQTLKDQQEQYNRETEAITRGLEEQRKLQRDASAAIAETLHRISSLFTALVGSGSAGAQGTRGIPASSGKATPKAVLQASKSAVTRVGKKGSRYATSGTESVTAFIRKHGNPTTAELVNHWKAEGRGGKVEAILGTMVKNKKLKRMPNSQGRGSRYSLI